MRYAKLAIESQPLSYAKVVAKGHTAAIRLDAGGRERHGQRLSRQR